MRALLVTVVLALFSQCGPGPGPLDAGMQTGGGRAGGGSAAGGTSGGGSSGGGNSGGGNSPVDGGLRPGSVSTRQVPGFPERTFEVRVPASSDGGALPVLLMLHGGGGNRANALEMSCQPDGGACLQDLALDAGFIVVIPEGTPGVGLAARFRTWNGGGGDGGWQCVSGLACNDRVDEAGFFSALLADLRSVVAVQPLRVFATGLSNGGALSHRLACELPAVRGIASVAAGNQFATLEPCQRRAAILEIHGTADPCWNFDGGPESCADQNPGIKVGVEATMAGWASRNACQPVPTMRSIADAGATDPTSVDEISWSGCAGGNDVVLLRVMNGGHTWPQGNEPRTPSSGRVSQAISANQRMLDFFLAH